MNTNSFKYQKLSLILMLLLTALSSVANAQNWSFHAATSMANKSLDKKGWQSHHIDESILKQDSYIGLMFDFQRNNWPVYFAADIYITGDSQKAGVIEEIALTTEVHLGMRKYWGTSANNWQAYAGTGINIVHGHYSLNNDGVENSDNDSDTGFWLGGGVNWYFNSNWYVGLDIRYSTGELTIFEQNREANGLITGFNIGITW